MHWYNLVPNYIYDYKLRHAEKTQKFTYKGMTVKAKMVDIYDGDTLTLVFRYRGQLQQHSCRMMGYDSPEMKPAKNKPNREAEIQAAKAAKEALKELLERHQIVTAKCHQFDKYGRILVTLMVPTRSGLFGRCCSEDMVVNQWMIDQGHGYVYDGGTKKNITYKVNKE